MPDKSPEQLCENDIKKTLAYASVFDSSLSFFQILNFLLGSENHSIRRIRKTMEHLVESKQVRQKKGRYYLAGTNIHDWYRNFEASQKLLNQNISTLKLLFSVPWVSLIAVTGSVAAYNADSEADLDVLIVAKPGRVWLTRGFTDLLLKLTGKFPKNGKERGKICTNLYVAEDRMSWPKDMRNVYTAHEVALVQPIFDRNNTYFKFMRANDWFLDYFPKVLISTQLPPQDENKKSYLIDMLEALAKKMQLAYMKHKITTETLTDHLIHFKKHDNSDRILTDFKKVIHKRKIS